MTRAFYTAAELAELAQTLGIKSFPGTKRGVNALVVREGWNSLPASLARQRSGREGGGGMEYHFSLLPAAMQARIAATEAQTALVVRHDVEAERDRRQVAALKSTALSAEQRKVLEARAEVLTSIEGYAVSHGQNRAWGIAQFLEAQAAYTVRQEIEGRRERGEFLTDREVASLGRPLELTRSEGFGLQADVLAAANDRGAGRVKISRSAIYDWFRLRDHDGVVALAPVQTKRPQPIPPGFAGFLRHYALPSKPTAAAALAEYMKGVTDPALALTIDQVNYVLRKKLNSIEKNIGREGILTLRSRMAYIQRSTEDMWPTTVYTADGKTFDAEIADPVSYRPMRPEITSVLDVATRKCVGYAISRKENVIAVTEALRRSVSSHGICAIFYTDRGAGYKNKTFDGQATPDAAVGGLMGRLGIAKMHALPYNSQAKGIIERFNAYWNDLAKTMPSYIGADMDKEAGSRVHKASRREIAEFGRSRILPSWDEFVALVDSWIAAYNDRPHRGLPRFQDPESGRMRHMSPNEAWAAHVATGFEPVLVHPDDEDDLFRPYEIRTVSRGLVRWNTNDYFHADLEAWHEKRVMVGYDLTQADRVWVREFDEDSGLPGKLICVATYAGNKARYVPLTYQRAAEEGRVKGQLRRIEAKRDAALETLRAPLLEVQPTMPIMPIVDPLPPREAPVAFALQADPARQEAAPIASDADLARLVLADPGQLTEGRARILREALDRRSARELLRISGVDLDALWDLLRSAA